MIAVWLGIVLIASALLARELARLYVRLADRAARNGRDSLPYAYEQPRYFTRGADGAVDTGARWPGWDAWTVCAIPNDSSLPPQMIRGTLMTGLYGLEGIDNYEALVYRLSSYHAVEHLCLTPTTVQTPSGAVTLNYLSQHYLPKRPNLRMDGDELDVTIFGAALEDESKGERYGELRGAWPEYYAELRNPEGEIRSELHFRGRRLVWWTDIPGRYTHVTAFGDFDVTMEYGRGTEIADPHLPLPNPRRLEFQARGALERTFAAKPFAFDRLWLPLRLVGRWWPALKPFLYHYEALVGDGVEGGFVQARAFGAEFRNRGGLYSGDGYHEVKRIRVEYGEADLMDNCGGLGELTPAYRTWRVRAETAAGEVAYSAVRTHPPAMVTNNMNQYHFTFEGAWGGKRIAGRGYGEYIHL